MSPRPPLRLWAVVFWLAVWQGLSLALAAAWPHGRLLLASPLEAAARLGELALTASFWQAVGVSSLRILGGFLLGCAAAAALAVPAAKCRLVRELLAPLVAAIKSVPVASFIILALVWVNSRHLSLLTAFLMAFPTVYLHTLEGIRRMDRQLLEMARVFRVPLLRRLRGLYLPQVLPFFRTAASLSMGLCWKAGTAAEVIGLPDGTIGEKLYSAKVYFLTPDLFAWTAVIVALSALMERVFLRIVDSLCAQGGQASR